MSTDTNTIQRSLPNKVFRPDDPKLVEAKAQLASWYDSKLQQVMQIADVGERIKAITEASNEYESMAQSRAADAAKLEAERESNKAKQLEAINAAASAALSTAWGQVKNILEASPVDVVKNYTLTIKASRGDDGVWSEPMYSYGDTKPRAATPNKPASNGAKRGGAKKPITVDGEVFESQQAVVKRFYPDSVGKLTGREVIIKRLVADKHNVTV
jgi:hypothetical protein